MTAHVDPAKPARQRRLHPPSGWVTGTVVVIVSLISIVLSAKASHESQATNDCQRDYVQSFTIALNARQDIADEDRATLDELIITISTATTPQQTRDAINRYISKRAAADKARAAHPLPDPRDGICGGRDLTTGKDGKS